MQIASLIHHASLVVSQFGSASLGGSNQYQPATIETRPWTTSGAKPLAEVEARGIGIHSIETFMRLLCTKRSLLPLSRIVIEFSSLLLETLRHSRVRSCL